MNSCVLSETTVSISQMHTATAADGSGWVTLGVLVTKPTLPSVDMQDGQITVAITHRTSVYRVLLLTLNMLVINFAVFDVFCVLCSVVLSFTSVGIRSRYVAKRNKTRSSATAEKQRVSCVCLSIGWLTDRTMNRTPQNRRCRTRLYSSRIDSIKKASDICGRWSFLTLYSHIHPSRSSVFVIRKPL